MFSETLSFGQLFQRQQWFNWNGWYLIMCYLRNSLSILLLVSRLESSCQKFRHWGFKFHWPGDLSWWTQVSRTIRSFLLTGFPSLQGYLNCFLFTCQSRMLFLTQKNREKYYCTLNRLRFCFMYIYHFQLFSTKKVGGKFEEQNKENPIADSRGTRWIQLVNLGVLSQERCC